MEISLVGSIQLSSDDGGQFSRFERDQYTNCFSQLKLNMAIGRCIQKIRTARYQHSGVYKLIAGGPLIRVHHDLSECSLPFQYWIRNNMR